MLLKLKSILRSRTGSSMLAVLAAMLLLMAMGGSALVAGSTAVGQVGSQRSHRQLELIMDSVNSSLLYMLQADDPTGKLLGKQLVQAIYRNAAQGDLIAPLPSTLDLEVTETGGADALPSGLDVDIVIYITPDVRITPYTREVTRAVLDPLGNITGYEVLVPRRPQRALVDALMEAVVTVKLDGRELICASTYRLADALLEDDGSNPDAMDFRTEDAHGSWELIKLERLG